MRRLVCAVLFFGLVSCGMDGVGTPGGNGSDGKPGKDGKPGEDAIEWVKVCKAEIDLKEDRLLKVTYTVTSYDRYVMCNLSRMFTSNKKDQYMESSSFVYPKTDSAHKEAPCWDSLVMVKMTEKGASLTRNEVSYELKCETY